MYFTKFQRAENSLATLKKKKKAQNKSYNTDYEFIKKKREEKH